MRILFDQGTPAPLRQHLAGHEVSTAHELGWSELQNGALLRAAERQFDVFITTDRNLRHEQNLADRRLAIIVLLTTSWPKIRRRVEVVLEAVNTIGPAMYCELEFAD